MPQTKTQSAPDYMRRSKLGEPTWELVERDFPRQGDWTEDEYLDLDNRGIEFVAGTLEFLPVPTKTHEKIKHFLYLALLAFASVRDLGFVFDSGMKVRVSTKRKREPDVLFMFTKHAHRCGENEWEGADLVMEIVSPAKDDRKRDYKTKRREYAEAGIQEYWIIDPELQKITVLALRKTKYVVHGEFGRNERVTSVLLKGFEVGVAEALAGVKG